MCDRRAPELRLCKSQQGFIEFVVLPILAAFCGHCGLTEPLDEAYTNHEQWSLESSVTFASLSEQLGFGGGVSTLASPPSPRIEVEVASPQSGRGGGSALRALPSMVGSLFGVGERSRPASPWGDSQREAASREDSNAGPGGRGHEQEPDITLTRGASPSGRELLRLGSFGAESEPSARSVSPGSNLVPVIPLGNMGWSRRQDRQPSR